MSQTAKFKLTIPVNATGNWYFGHAGFTEMTDLAGLRAAGNQTYPGTVHIEPDPANGASLNAYTIEFPIVYQPDTTGMGPAGHDPDGTPILPISGVLTDTDGNPHPVTTECVRRNLWEAETTPETETPPNAE